MRLSVPQMRAIPLLVLGAGVFILAATFEMPVDTVGPAIDVPALHAGSYAVGIDPSACADSTAPDCVIDAASGSVLAVAP